MDEVALGGGSLWRGSTESVLPTGTLTFLFTDIAESTRLWERQRDGMRTALARHDAVIERLVVEYGGTVVRPRGEGDSRFAVFTQASAAVSAAAAIQVALHDERWPIQEPLLVRMALNTGEADLRDGDYYGNAVNRCARLRALAHGEQVLLSGTTAALVRNDLPAGLALRSLGVHVLKDVAEPESIFQLIHPRLRVDFPALRTVGVRPSNLPPQRAAIIGRERELAEAVRLLRREDIGVVTLVGPGGSGKTRLGLGLAYELLSEFDDGVFFVPLAPISDPSLVVPTIAQVLRLRDLGSRPLAEILEDVLRDKRVLLVLDNFEQVLQAAPSVANLSNTCARLKILITSRAPLGLREEREFPVPPLELPDRRHPPQASALSQYAGVALFIERARAVRPDFAVTNDNAPAVAEICHRLDGLPLAIELAAARVRFLSPHAMLARLDRSLPLLTGGARDLPTRQQTLRATIAWSYDLASEAEQALFRRLAIFVAGFGIDAAEQVWGTENHPPFDVLNAIGSLVAQNLVRQEPDLLGEPRFGMLQTIREFGLERLEGSGELDAVRSQLASFVTRLAGDASPHLRSGEQLAWLERVEREYDNVRAVLTLSGDDALDPTIGLHVAARLWWFWHHHSHFAEGRSWLEAAHLAAGHQESAESGEAWVGAGVLAFNQSDNAAARDHLDRALALGRQLGDKRVMGQALLYQAVLAANVDGDLDLAGTLHEQAERMFRGVSDVWGLAINRSRQASVARMRGDYSGARAFGEESLALFRDTGDRFGLGHALLGLGQIALESGDARGAAMRYAAAIEPLQQIGNVWFTSRALLGLARAICAQGELERAATLLGTADRLREDVGAPVYASDRPGYERIILELRTELDNITFEQAYLAGRAMEPEQVLARPQPA